MACLLDHITLCQPLQRCVWYETNGWRNEKFSNWNIRNNWVKLKIFHFRYPSLPISYTTELFCRFDWKKLFKTFGLNQVPAQHVIKCGHHKDCWCIKIYSDPCCRAGVLNLHCFATCCTVRINFVGKKAIPPCFEIKLTKSLWDSK